MPLAIVPPTLLNAQALPVDGADTHVQPGAHLRVTAHPLLGLPVAPFVIWRAVALDGGAGAAIRETVLFVDSRGSIRTPPFTVTSDNPVTAYPLIGIGETCIWARVLVDAAPDPVPQFETPTGPSPTMPVIRPLRDRMRAVRQRAPGASIAGPTPARARARGGISVSAFVTTPRGLALAGRRDDDPFSFGAPGLFALEITGAGTVTGLRWIEASDPQPKLDFAPWGILNLPHAGGPRYLSIVGAIARTALRVLDQAPKRRPLQETLGALPPGSAPVATAAYEALRVNALAAPLRPDLDALIGDLTQSPFDQRVVEPAFDAAGREIGTFDQARLDRVLQAQLDPGCAALFGYKARDREAADTGTALVFYWVAGFFRDFPAPFALPSVDIGFDAQLAALASDNRIGDDRKLVSVVERLMDGIPATQINAATRGELEQHGDYIGLGALAVADMAAPLLPVDPPRIDAASHVGWVPELVPAARREVALAISGALHGGLLAGEKQTPSGGALRESLNKANALGAHLPLVLGVVDDQSALAPEPEPGTGSLGDRHAAPEPVRYHLAQQDRFGRWSNWASAVALSAPRPAPPRPVLRATYKQPANAARSGGTVRVQVDVPQLAALAPGAFPIDALILTGEDLTLGTIVKRTIAIADPEAPPATIDESEPGPRLAPTERRQLKIIAQFRDSNGAYSHPSEPQTLTMTDPRPPAQITLPDTLLYSGRPDIAGLSWVEHAWTTQPDQANFAVYYSDENRLRAHLDTLGKRALLRALDAAGPDAAARASVYRDNAALFPASLFERLDGVVVEVDATRKAFRHAVSASLKILNVYRIAAESASNARVDLTTLPLLIYGVPVIDPPPRPVLEVVPGDAFADNAGPYEARIRIAVTTGTVAAETWRLRRSTLGATDALRMPIVMTGTIAPAGTDGRQRAEHVDTGPVVISPSASLKPWIRYHWVADVQAAPAPGSVAAGRPVPGAWSPPSEPVSLILVPPQPPAAAITLSVYGDAIGNGSSLDVILKFEHPHELAGGALGAYRARVFRRLPGGRMEMLPDVEITGSVSFKISGVRTATEEVPAGTLYRLSLIDPLGREGAAIEAVLS